MGSSDDEWVEEELLRRLEQEDGEDDEEERATPPPEAEQGGESSMMQHFREYMAQMEQWGNAAAQQMDAALLETMAAASNAERDLEARPAPPELLLAEPPAPDAALSALELDLEFEEGAVRPEAAMEDSLNFLAGIAAQARAEALQQLAACELQEAAIEEDEPEQVDAAAGDSLEVIQRRIEEERLACVAALEKQHQELLQQMQREEEERREEEAQLQEQVRMHSEELASRQFDMEERSAQRREGRAMRREDALSRQAREEERRVKEDAERAREAWERRRLEVEDQSSRAVRRREHEQRELRSLDLEDKLSHAWRRKLRMDFESQRFSEADAQSRRWRDLYKEAQEADRMSSEDQRSQMMRLRNTSVLHIHRSGCGQEETIKVAESQCDVVLSKMIMPVTEGSGGSGGSGAGAPELPTGDLNPWEKLTTRRPSKAKEAKTCGNMICMKLLEGAKRKRGRRRAASTACRPPALASSESGELAVDLAGGLEDLMGPASSLVRLEVRMEGLESLPLLSRLPQLRTLVLSGNKIHGSLEALKHSPHLEELDLCQNSLTSLDGLRHLKYLSVLKATMNEISDAEDLAHLSMLRVVDLSKNRLSSVPLSAPALAKLVLYRNAIDSTSILRSLPSLSQVDLGRNKLTELDDISEWNPLLTKAFLYENHLAALPELHLPLLTDLWVDNNELEVLGPLGFLPSLERLQAKHNRIRTLAQPIAASPLLKTLELAFNQLEATDIPRAVSPLLRLTRLQLNDNPLVNDLMEEYRPWVLRIAPHLEELDNETVSEVERRSPAPSLGSLGMGRAVARGWSKEPAAQRRPGLLGLVAPKSAVQRQPAAEGEGAPLSPCLETPVLERWKAAWSTPGPAPEEGGCQMCALACWCEALNTARSVPLVAHTREERRTAAMSATRSQHDALFALQRRHDFWKAFLELCAAQWSSLSPWISQSCVLRSPVFELQIPGAERSTQELLRKVQSRWRGCRARKEVAQLRLERLCQALTQSQENRLLQVQALWRGQRQRQVLRKQGWVLPGDRRLAEYGRAATQLQAALRGSRLRQKLRWAREVSKITDDLEECPEVDLDDLLSNARRVAEADPFSLRLPQAKAPSAYLSSKDVASTVPVSQPMAAWGTPPPTAGDRQDGSAPGTPGTSRADLGLAGLAGPRRSRSLSSTAESAMTETGSRNKVEQAKEDWGFKEASTARNYLKAQRRRQPRPPTLPGGSLHSLTPTHRKPASTRATDRAGGGGGGCNAQEAIQEYRRQQEASESLEFQSGSPNRKLMRSSKSLG